jgi:hypothetical protein
MSSGQAHIYETPFSTHIRSYPRQPMADGAHAVAVSAFFEVQQLHFLRISVR